MGEFFIDDRRQIEMYLLSEIQAKVRASHLRVKWLADYNVFVETVSERIAVAILITKDSKILVLTYDIQRDPTIWKTWDDHINPDTAIHKQQFNRNEIDPAATVVILELMSV
ncbi:hypothetical protein AVT69_gp225 [Pseudomonas phage PhiPA3]|uniref:Uncharacterized protein 227 n=1 Tax=Pseudomonas phage PhiPA3 TaxID=998086 RepID=F8SJ70_BPPA3|nr:hypothetical protein AVT69_gp225 [Pseudomonas phage PhiPA3]AEH03650.1 hypothetical protein [Pseudomonas phage PhiPA3]